jgi:hypothetical protein
MATPTVIKDHKSANAARVTDFGQLVVAPLDYSKPVTKPLTPINTAFNFIEPAQGQSIVITDIITSANKDVSNVDPANVVIYQASAPDTLIVDELIVSPQLTRGGNLPLTGLNLIVPEGKWVNAFTNDDIILLAIMFYRVPVEVLG